MRHYSQTSLSTHLRPYTELNGAHRIGAVPIASMYSALLISSMGDVVERSFAISGIPDKIIVDDKGETKAEYVSIKRMTFFLLGENRS